MKDYKEIPIKYICYILKIHDKDIFKVGITNRLKARMRNLRVSMYEDVDCVNEYEFNDRQEALNCERMIKKESEKWRIKGEWYTRIEKIEKLKSE